MTGLAAGFLAGRLLGRRRRLRSLAPRRRRLEIVEQVANLCFECRMINVVERYADGAATRAEFLATRKAARTAIQDKVPGTRALEHLADDAMEALTLTIEIVRTRSGGAAQCGLMRCVFGNPYRTAARSFGARLQSPNDVGINHDFDEEVPSARRAHAKPIADRVPTFRPRRRHLRMAPRVVVPHSESQHLVDETEPRFYLCVDPFTASWSGRRTGDEVEQAHHDTSLGSPA